MTHRAARRVRHDRRGFWAVAILLSLSLAFTVLGATSAFAITRDQVLARAQTRVDAPVPYSQAKSYAGYRTDCSGYVSMCWSTGTSWSTRSFYKVSRRISVSQLKPGDALLKPGYHVRLFYGWVDAEHTRYVAYESANGRIAGTRTHSLAQDLAYGYVPTRYNGITDSPASRNLMQNGSFNTWASSWGSQAEQPVWWQVDGPWRQTLVAHRKDTYRSARNSLRLINPSGDSTITSGLSQSVPVVAGAPYRLSAWAATSFDPQRVTLKLAYLDTTGTPLAETFVTGDRAQLIGDSFKSMSVLATSPPGAVRALVSVQLAGGTTTSTAGTPVRGGSVTLDDLSLVRPQVTVGIKTSIARAAYRKTAILSGAVTPRGAIGAPVTVYVKRPGAGWTTLGVSRVYASGSAGAWKSKFAFKSGLRKGTYHFKTKVGGYPGYLGATTGVVSVVLK